MLAVARVSSAEIRMCRKGEREEARDGKRGKEREEEEEERERERVSGSKIGGI